MVKQKYLLCIEKPICLLNQMLASNSHQTLSNVVSTNRGENRPITSYIDGNIFKQRTKECSSFAKKTRNVPLFNRFVSSSYQTRSDVHKNTGKFICPNASLHSSSNFIKTFSSTFFGALFQIRIKLHPPCNINSFGDQMDHLFGLLINI